MLRRVFCLFPKDGHSAVIGFTDAVCFLPDVHTFQVVVVQQMIATVLELVDSIEFNVAEWAHPGLVRTDSDQLREGQHSEWRAADDLVESVLDSSGDVVSIQGTPVERRQQQGEKGVEKMLQRLQDAINLAFAALANIKCGSLFGLTAGSANPSYLLQQLEKGTGGFGYFTIGDIAKQQNLVTSATTAPIQSLVDIGYGNSSQLQTTGVIITINDLEGSFTGSDPIAQAATVLHELGHAFSDLWGQSSTKIKDDNKTVPNYVDVSKGNTTLINKDCFNR
jgi:hypothetical protein